MASEKRSSTIFWWEKLKKSLIWNNKSKYREEIKKEIDFREWWKKTTTTEEKYWEDFISFYKAMEEAR
jgi:hypothetical protein